MLSGVYKSNITSFPEIYNWPADYGQKEGKYENLTLKEQGNDYNALKDLLSDIDNSTELLNINTAAMGIYSPIKPSVKGNSTYVFPA